MIQSISIIGNGKVSQYLEKAFLQSGIEVQVYARNPKLKQHLALNKLRGNNDLTIICVSDAAIASLSSSIPQQRGILVHSSGTAPLNTLDSKHPNRGIFYPLMSINAQTNLSLGDVPFCLEASSAACLKELETWADINKFNHYHIQSEQRKQLHLAAVISQNFTNYLYHWAFTVMQAGNMPMNLLKPLLQQQVAQLNEDDPIVRQTGPAIRGDQSTMNTHLEMLKNAELAALYQKVSSLIQKTHEEEL